MLWASSLSEKTSLEEAVAECAASVREQLKGAPVDFLCVFVSMAFAGRYDQVGALAARRLPSRLLLGCSAGGVIGGGQEVEEKAALSFTAASLPGVSLKPFYVQDEDMPDMDASPRAWEELVGVKAAEGPQFLLLADPFSIRADNFIMGLDYAFPKAAKVGGLASGAAEPGQNALYLDGHCQRAGLVGVAFTGDLEMDTIVAQGCKPIGKPLRVTDCRQNILMALDEKPPLEVLRSLAETLTPGDRELLRHALFLGLATDPGKEKYGRGDFLIRNILGADNEQGLLAVGALLRKGQTVQFHLRDAKTSAEDLRLMLGRFTAKKDKARGAMLFSCMGRGRQLYGRPHHDSKLFASNIGPVPLGGFFCNGEIGPVGGATHLHGYTSCFGLFRPKEKA